MIVNHCTCSENSSSPLKGMNDRQCMLIYRLGIDNTYMSFAVGYKYHRFRSLITLRPINNERTHYTEKKIPPELLQYR